MQLDRVGKESPRRTMAGDAARWAAWSGTTRRCLAAAVDERFAGRNGRAALAADGERRVQEARRLNHQKQGVRLMDQQESRHPFLIRRAGGMDEQQLRKNQLYVVMNGPGCAS